MMPATPLPMPAPGPCAGLWPATGDNPPLCTQCHRGAQDGVLAFSLE